MSSPAVRWIELHETEMKGATAKMKRRKEVEFPSRGELVFEPGGRHAMLFGISPKVKAGRPHPLTFSFNVAPPVTVEAEVRGPADEDPHEGALSARRPGVGRGLGGLTQRDLDR